jgi:hypothetical protein
MLGLILQNSVFQPFLFTACLKSLEIHDNNDATIKLYGSFLNVCQRVVTSFSCWFDSTFVTLSFRHTKFVFDVYNFLTDVDVLGEACTPLLKLDQKCFIRCRCTLSTIPANSNYQVQSNSVITNSSGPRVRCCRGSL